MKKHSSSTSQLPELPAAPALSTSRRRAWRTADDPPRYPCRSGETKRGFSPKKIHGSPVGYLYLCIYIYVYLSMYLLIYIFIDVLIYYLSIYLFIYLVR